MGIGADSGPYSLYVTNLPSAKIQKSDLQTALYMLFSTYGSVLDVVALKTMKMRGQAHIVFRDMHAATQAMRALEGFQFLGKELVCDAQTFYLAGSAMCHSVMLTGRSESNMPHQNLTPLRNWTGPTRCPDLPLLMSR